MDENDKLHNWFVVYIDAAKIAKARGRPEIVATLKHFYDIERGQRLTDSDIDAMFGR